MDDYVETIVAGGTHEGGYYHGAAHCAHSPHGVERWDIVLTRNSVQEHTVIASSRRRAEYIVQEWAFAAQAPEEEQV